MAGAPKRAKTDFSDADRQKFEDRSNDMQQNLSNSESLDSNEQLSITCQSKLSQFSLPETVSDWTRDHINGLHIDVLFQPLFKPLHLITSPLQMEGLCFRISAYDVEKINNRRKAQIRKITLLADYVKRSAFIDMIQNLNYSSFKELNIDSLMKLKSFNEHCFIPKGLPEDSDAWFQRFDVYGKNFICVLSRMIENKIQGIPNLQCHYQHLFDTLLKMFGLQSGISVGPGLPEQTLKIGHFEVKGKPDMLYAHHKIDYVDRKLEKPCIVAVCEVMKEKPVVVSNTASQDTVKTTGISADSEMKNLSDISSTAHNLEQSSGRPVHLSPALIGQHCGKLLLSYTQSFGHNFINGIVVQQTQVTITELRMTETQYQNIMEGKYTHSDGKRPAFVYTRSYDFLMKEDLEVLVDLFIKFGLDQDQ
ncbi:uncharacterized protein LOC133192713 [Saccostrea echinata]|uniref:uncharacterized protein LOC133192713 n=1 Tax=Saccostrea echinata TaxID=191078 RepID=UPI002A808D41|nr:uncharacterized protein LOC133192713 [Saccostrea echinata]